MNRKSLGILILTICVLACTALPTESAEGDRNSFNITVPAFSTMAAADNPEAAANTFRKGTIGITGVIITVLLIICSLLYREYQLQLRRIQNLRKTVHSLQPRPKRKAPQFTNQRKRHNPEPNRFLRMKRMSTSLDESRVAVVA